MAKLYDRVSGRREDIARLIQQPQFWWYYCDCKAVYGRAHQYRDTGDADQRRRSPPTPQRERPEDCHFSRFLLYEELTELVRRHNWADQSVDRRGNSLSRGTPHGTWRGGSGFDYHSRSCRLEPRPEPETVVGEPEPGCGTPEAVTREMTTQSRNISECVSENCKY